MKNVLIVTKVPAWHRFKTDPVKYANISKGTLQRAEDSNNRHVESVERVHDSVKKFTSAIKVRGVNELTTVDVGLADLVITVGGDGTLLSASHYIPPNTLVIGVNSDPVFSRGNFCHFKAGEFDDVLEELLAFGVPSDHNTKWVTRMKASINGVPIVDRVLNEALFCHSCPAAMTRFTLNGIRYACSGVWIATGAGSTGAIKSAGGSQVDTGAQVLQTMLREVWEGDKEHPSLDKLSYVTPSVTLTSRIADAMLYFDGPYLSQSVGIDQEVTFEVSDQHLSLVTR